MNLREFLRFHLLKVLLAFIVLQLGIVAFIQSYNHRPKALTDQASVTEEKTVKVSPLVNDTDKDKKDELSLKNVFSPLHGKVEQKANLVYYTPEKGFTGKDSLGYTITDGKKESKEAYIVIQVNKNLPPETNHDIADVFSGNSTVINVLDNDTDKEGDSIFIKQFTQPLYGQLHAWGNKLVYSAANTSVAQTDSFTYTACDSKSNSNETTVLVTVKSKNDPCHPWLSSDIGDVAKPGSFTGSNNSYTMEASGSDIWNNRDGFRYAYQYVNGDCEMSVKVESLEGTNEWAKAGLMIREDLSGGSKTAFVCVTTKNGATYHQRSQTSDSMEGGDSNSGIKAPYWVKIKRTGETFSFYISANGNDWKKIGNSNVSMNKNVYIGLALTSHDNNELAKAVFSHYTLNSKAAKFEF